MAEMSPEVDLLERLTGEDATLDDAAFGSCFKFHDLAHAQRVASIYVKSGFVELYDKQAEPQAAMPFYTAKWLIEDDANWKKGTPYTLRLTEDGYKQFLEDSAGFFDQLFSELP